MIHAVMAIVHMVAVFAILGGLGFLVASVYRSIRQKQMLPELLKSVAILFVGLAIIGIEIYFQDAIYGKSEEETVAKHSADHRSESLQSIYENGIEVKGEVVSKVLQWSVTVNGRPKFAWITYRFNDAGGKAFEGAMQIDASLLLLGNSFNKGDTIVLRYLKHDPKQNMISY